MSIEDRPEFKAAMIRREADGLDPIHEAVRETYRAKIMAIISSIACADGKPTDEVPHAVSWLND